MIYHVNDVERQLREIPTGGGSGTASSVGSSEPYLEPARIGAHTPTKQHRTILVVGRFFYDTERDLLDLRKALSDLRAGAGSQVMVGAWQSGTSGQGELRVRSSTTD